MKCIYCGEELQDNSVYCSHCGKSVQIVPDYNVYDDDYLKQILEEENRKRPIVRRAVSKSSNGNSSSPETPKNPKEQKAMQMKIIAGVIGTVCVLIFALLILGAAIRTNHNNSYEYQVELAEKAYRSGNPDKAIEYYKKALDLDKNSIEAKLALAGIYMEQRDFEMALVLYQEVITADKKNREAFKNLIAIYEKQDNTEAVMSLSKVADESIKDLFADYMVLSPSFSLEEGIFKSAQVLQLISVDGDLIFYTLDGSDPVAHGTAYSSPIDLKEHDKTYIVKAVCMNKKKIYSQVVTREYRIEIPAPDMPIVSPDGGDFGVETTVTITVPNGCSAYYTWDGSIPNVSSRLYTQPILIPEGNNILSVIIVDNNTKLCSDVYKGNFIYYSENYEDVEPEDIEEKEE